MEYLQYRNESLEGFMLIFKILKRNFNSTVQLMLIILKTSGTIDKKPRISEKFVSWARITKL